VTASQEHPFSEDDIEIYEEAAKAINGQKSHLVNIVPIEPSRKKLK
jgi:hypothetical protein